MTLHRPHRMLLVIVCAALLASPPTWAAIALGAAAIGVLAAGEVRAAMRRMRVTSTEAPETGVELGADSEGRRVVLSDQQLSAHALILGASGAGKSTTLLTLLTEHVRMGRPVVAIDMKGSPEFARGLARAAAEAGRPFALWTPDGPGVWNPLAHGNATELKDKLIATERFTEPHYQRAAERYVQTVLQLLHSARPAQPPTLEDVVGLMDPHRLAGLLRDVPQPLAQRVQDYVGSLGHDQLSAIRGLGTRLAIITEAHTGSYLKGQPDGRPAVDLRGALAGDSVVLFSLNSGRYGKLSAQLGALAIQDLVSAAGHRLTLGERGERAVVGIDEFSALDSDNVISLLARCREAGVSVLLSTQELADLDRFARGLRDQILGSTAIKIAHRQEVPASARTIAQIAGSETVWEESRQMSSHPLFGLRDTGRGTRRQVERFKVHPDQISSLAPGQAVLISKVPNASVRTVRVSPPRRVSRQGPELG